MTLRLQLHQGKNFATTTTNAYAPTMINKDETRDKFYEDFEFVISVVPAPDKLIILGDFNGSVRQDRASWEGVLDKYGIGKCNSNGLLFVQICAKRNLITNTVFRLLTHSKISWTHFCSEHWHLFDHVIVRRRDKQDVRVTRVVGDAECWTDHRLILSKLSIRVQLKTKPQGEKKGTKATEYYHIYPTPPLEQDMTQGQFLSGV